MGLKPELYVWLRAGKHGGAHLTEPLVHDAKVCRKTNKIIELQGCTKGAAKGGGLHLYLNLHPILLVYCAERREFEMKGTRAEFHTPNV
jgi:hypothetical protein